MNAKLGMTGVVLAGLFATGTAADGPWREIPYTSMYDALSRFEVGDAKYARAELRFVVPDDVLPADGLRLIIMAADGPVEVELADDGRAAFPLTEALRAENPPVRTNAPPGKLSVSIAFVSEAPVRQQFSYALLLEMAAEYASLVAQQGFLARMAAPKPDGLLVEFDPASPAAATVRGRTTEVLATDEQGTLLIPLRRDWRRAPPEIELSQMPLRMTLAL